MNRMFPPVIGYLDSNIKKLSKGDLKNAVTAKYGFAKLEMRNFRHDTLIEFINIQDRNRLYYTCDFEMEECLDRTIYGMYDRFIPLSGPKKSNRISYILFNQKELVAEIEKKLSFLESTPEKRMTRKEIFEKYGVVVSD